MATPGIKKYRKQVQEVFTIIDTLFLLLRLVTIVGSTVWLIFAPLNDLITTNYYASLAIFSLYSLILYVLIFFQSHKIRSIYLFSLLLDLIFIFYLVDLVSGSHNSFFLCYYLLVLLHTLYFGHTFGMLVATISAGLYLVNILPQLESIHWTDAGLRILFLYLLSFPAGIIHGKLKKDKKNIEKLNEQLGESIENLKAMQTRLIESEKLSALGRLTETVAHEIRNPLMALGGFSRRLSKLLSDDSKEKQYAQTIVSEVARLESILRDVLLFTSKRGGLQRGDLNHVVQNAAAHFINLFATDQIYKTVENYLPDIPLIYLDQDQLRQVISNLIGNSIDAMPEGGTLTISTNRTFFNEIEWITLTIKDTGKGMTQKQSELIFEPFYSTKRIGTGLGLTIVHEIMEEHRGFVKTDSIEGSGTSFTLYFPYQKEEEDTVTPCWEYLGCGIETDPGRRCPAYPYFGRNCWAIAGTMCQGKVMGTYAEKLNNCNMCSFFQHCRDNDNSHD
jgi:signal transduction histidine kinase